MIKICLLVVALSFFGSIDANDVASHRLRPKEKADLRGRLLTPEEGCGYSKVASTKIVGGSEAKIGAYPWIALLGYNEDDDGLYSFDCGGSLITSRHVLTAAHCINYTTLEIVRLGEHDLNTEMDGRHHDYWIFEMYKHKKYDTKDYRNDIAIITLADNVRFTARIRPICLPMHAEILTMNFVGANPFTAGWGATEENGTASDVLMDVQVPVLENKVCQEAFKREGELVHRFQFDRTVLCAGHLGGGMDSCQGDSGGPLMLPHYEDGKFPFYQIGVVSYGIGCGNHNMPGVYVNIPYYMDWITKNIKNLD